MYLSVLSRFTPFSLRCSCGPIPDSMSSLGVLTDPAHKMTSFLAYASFILEIQIKMNDYWHITKQNKSTIFKHCSIQLFNLGFSASMLFWLSYLISITNALQPLSLHTWLLWRNFTPVARMLLSKII